MKTTYIKDFMFDKARYLISDGDVDVVLKVDYKDNEYQIESEQIEIPQALKEEISTIAKDLLQRKRQKNFAEPIHKAPLT